MSLLTFLHVLFSWITWHIKLSSQLPENFFGHHLNEGLNFCVLWVVTESLHAYVFYFNIPQIQLLPTVQLKVSSKIYRKIYCIAICLYNLSLVYCQCRKMHLNFKQDFSLSCLMPLGGGPNLAASFFITSLSSSLFSVHPAKLAQILFIPIFTNAVSSQTSLILVLPCAFKTQLVKYVPCLLLHYITAFTCSFATLFNCLDMIVCLCCWVIHSFCLYIYLLFVSISCCLLSS